MYSKFHDFFPTGASSLTTSGPYLVVDYGVQSIQVGASASTVTLQGSNYNGFDAALPEAAWSNLSVMALAGVFKIEVGYRWARVIRTSSANTVYFSGVQRD